MTWQEMEKVSREIDEKAKKTMDECFRLYGQFPPPEEKQNKPVAKAKKKLVLRCAKCHKERFLGYGLSYRKGVGWLCEKCLKREV